jgi:hypothetical protein
LPGATDDEDQGVDLTLVASLKEDQKVRTVFPDDGVTFLTANPWVLCQLRSKKAGVDATEVVKAAAEERRKALAALAEEDDAEHGGKELDAASKVDKVLQGAFIGGTGEAIKEEENKYMFVPQDEWCG